MAKVLIIDDEELICSLVVEWMAQTGHQAFSAHTLEQGMKTAQLEGVDLIFLDVNMPDGNGIEIIDFLRSTSSRPEVIIITGNGSMEDATIAIRGNAWDYVHKPLVKEPLLAEVDHVLQYRITLTSAEASFEENCRHGILGESTPIVRCLRQVPEAAHRDVKILITGETGTGKELFARAIHANSPRKNEPFVVVDCASMSESLAGDLLFGHQKGGFTGAHDTRTGLVAEANRGTLFIDEIGEMGLEIQKYFLRLLQESTYQPIGSRERISSDFRLISATNRNLETQVAAGRFRSDLYYRIRGLSISLPPLRERGDDALLLAGEFITQVSQRTQQPPKSIAHDCTEIITSYPWPGNVRELYSAIEEAVVKSGSVLSFTPNTCQKTFA